MFPRELRRAEREPRQELYLRGVDLIHLELTLFRGLRRQPGSCEYFASIEAKKARDKWENSINLVLTDR